MNSLFKFDSFPFMGVAFSSLLLSLSFHTASSEAQEKMVVQRSSFPVEPSTPLQERSVVTGLQVSHSLMIHGYNRSQISLCSAL